MNHIKMEILSNKKNIQLIRNIAGVLLLDKNPTMVFINETKTILSEAVTNAMVHGYEGRENEIIYLDFFIDDSEIKMIVEDKGVGIEDLEMAKTPLYSSKRSEERSGLGFTIMELFSDTFDCKTILNEGTIVTMVKKFK